MVTIFVRIKVEDYGKWKRVYDRFASLRKERGAQTATIYRDPKDSNVVISEVQFKDWDSAMTWGDSKELRSAMAEAGVIGPPETWFGEEIEHVSY
jgi:hypothetical protein